MERVELNLVRRGGAAIAPLALLLSACVTAPAPPPAVPPVPAAVPIGPTEVERAIERRRGAALKAEQAQDLTAASRHWQVVQLLAPGDRQAAERLAALQASMARIAKDELAAGLDSLRRGDANQAQRSLLRVLALDADSKDAIDALREIDRQREMRRGAERAARAREEALVSARGRSTRRQAPDAGDYDVEQSLELLRAGDSVVALAELRRYVSANPRDRALRERIAGAVWARAQALELEGAGEAAANMYAEAVKLHPAAPREWVAQVTQLKKRLAGQEYEKGVQLMSSDVAAAITHFETALRLVPNHTQAQLRLERAHKIQQTLRSIGPPAGTTK